MNNNNKTLYIIGGIVVGIILTAIFTPVTRYGFGRMMFQGNTNYITKTTNNNSIDEHFIEQMIPHHDGAVAMAKLALKKAIRPEIKTLATVIIESQTKEIQDMNGWYKDWFVNDVPKVNTGMMGEGMMSQSGMHMGGQEDIVNLENAIDFDKAFLEAMIPHHQLALMMVRMLEAGSNRPEMLQLAKNITVSQSKEIQEMQGWYQQWYK